MIELPESRGLVGTVVLTGHVERVFANALSELRSHMDRQYPQVSIEYMQINGVLVEQSRDDLARHMLAQGYDWMLQVDADAGPFPADALARLLAVPDVAAVGAYAQVKNLPFYPTIDTGTGSWEPWTAGNGLKQVIRTGCHFLLTRRICFETLPQPWFRTRIAPAPVDTMRDMDNFARVNSDGVNPLWSDDWVRLLTVAREKGSSSSHVGEDSAFFDSLAAAGLKAAVDTDLVVGHVAERVIMPDDFQAEIAKILRRQRLALGVGAPLTAPVP